VSKTRFTTAELDALIAMPAPADAQELAELIRPRLRSSFASLLAIMRDGRENAARVAAAETIISLARRAPAAGEPAEFVEIRAEARALEAFALAILKSAGRARPH
jgi:hypothetical protein